LTRLDVVIADLSNRERLGVAPLVARLLDDYLVLPAYHARQSHASCRRV
jgi:hypothetical protein